MKSSHVSLTRGSSSTSEAARLETSWVATRGPGRPSLESLRWGQFHNLHLSPDLCGGLTQVLELREEESHILLLRLPGSPPGENLDVSRMGLGHPGRRPLTAAVPLEPYLSGRLQLRRTVRS